MKQLSIREATVILRENGFKESRYGKGSHIIFANGDRKISIPTSGKDINKMLFRRLCKENGIKL